MIKFIISEFKFNFDKKIEPDKDLKLSFADQ